MIVPPKCEANLTGRVMYADLAKYDGNWLTKPKQIRGALVVARTLVSNSTPEVLVRVVNLGDRELRFQREVSFVNWRK